MVKMQSSEYSDYTAQLKMVYCIDLRMIKMHGSQYVDHVRYLEEVYGVSEIWRVSVRYECIESEGEICRQKLIDEKCMIESMWS